MKEGTMKKTLFTAIVLAGITFNQGLAADKLKSFDHAAELTSQAKTILFQELNIAKVPNSGHQQIVCLAENIYFEARAESMEGKAGVANVTRNRVNDARWPSTYCEVVQQGPVRESWKTKKNPDLADEDRVYYPRKHRCQFSWYCDGLRDIIWANKEKTGITIEANARAWRDSVKVAIYTLGFGSYRVNDNTDGAVYYYAHNLVTPSWSHTKDLTVIVGNHTFMK
jgi:spore germination cell wall hydrolase CwlJ-like protein